MGTAVIRVPADEVYIPKEREGGMEVVPFREEGTIYETEKEAVIPWRSCVYILLRLLGNIRMQLINRNSTLAKP
jgi:hypothetical protein